MKRSDRRALQDRLGSWVAIPLPDEEYLIALLSGWSEEEGWASVYILKEERDAKVPLESLIEWLDNGVSVSNEASA